MTLFSKEPIDLVADLDQKALLNLATDSDSQPPRSFRLPTQEELQELFPDLEILELLGTGGMGCVFKAKQKKLDRMVALKILPRELASDELFAERFSREARAMARLDHPNIVAIYDFGQVKDMHFLTMQYMDGMNLRELIDANAIEANESIAVFTQVANALAFAHGEGVVHRDIKPENILFDRQGHVALADFGLARLAMDSHCEISLTQTRQAMGTLNYMAPEQYENPKAVDHRADVYAMGVLLYELITGKIPRGSFPPASSLVPNGPKVDHAINKALQVSPADRYVSVEDMVVDMANEETVIMPAFANNGTMTNFVNLGAAPFRMVGRLAKKARADSSEPGESGNGRTWLPLHHMVYIVIAFTFLLMLFPWTRAARTQVVTSDGVAHWAETEPSIGLFEQAGGSVPVVLLLPILAVLSQLAKYRQRMHPLRWFVMSFLCLAGAMGLVTGGMSPRDATFPLFAFLFVMTILILEHVLVILNSIWTKLKHAKRGA